ncbi:Protein kinase superfamily protein [Zea mays]|uniref:non-specific serine/threonine protein kinase n=1 Tax=Zea mays TaxID=4577 RepID=A0A1D6GQJ0_MAIZE|nr:Protein kinase superfamily protein [Zea mays]
MHCFKWLLGFMDMSQEQEQDFGVLLKQGAEGEARCMTKARRLGVPTPVLYAVDPVLHTLTFEHVDGLSVKDILLRFGSDGVNEERLNDIATQIGNAIGKLHDGGLVHGDLTTSNMIIKNSNNQLVLIDFGLSFTSTIPEDKAVDLYVLERALISMHSSCGDVQTYVGNITDLDDEPDGENPGCVQKGFEAMVLHPEQAGSSEATGQEAHHGRMNGEEEKYVAWNGSVSGFGCCNVCEIWKYVAWLHHLVRTQKQSVVSSGSGRSFIRFSCMITGRHGWGMACLFVPSIDMIIMANVLPVLWVRVDPYRTVEWVEWR